MSRPLYPLVPIILTLYLQVQIAGAPRDSPLSDETSLVSADAALAGALAVGTGTAKVSADMIRSPICQMPEPAHRSDHPPTSYSSDAALVSEDRTGTGPMNTP
jgi:hypothetical protein